MALVCISVLIFFCAAKVEAGAPVLGKDSLPVVHLFEEHSEALAHWASRGIRGAVLVNIDAHDDMRLIPKVKIEKLRRIYRGKEWDLMSDTRSGSEASLYHIGNFIFAAARLGIVDRVYWVIPFPYFSESNPENALREFLRGYAFPEEDIRTFRLEHGRFQGRFQGVPLIICEAAALPDVTSPLILSVDVDFFPPFARAAGIELSAAVYSVFGELFQKEYRIQDSFVAYSVYGGYLSPLHRWVGDLCVEVMEQPELLQGPLPKSFELQQLADRLYEEDSAEALLETAVAGLDSFPGDPCLKLYAAFASFGAGDTAQAYHYAKRACLEEPGYCPGLADIGQCLIDQGLVEESIPFFETAYSLQPEMNYRLKNLADALETAGRPREALRYHEIHEARNGAFPAAFRIGGIHLDLEEEDKATQALWRGIAAVENDPYIEVRCPEDAAALRKAVVFFEERGMVETSAVLKRHPFLRDVFASGGSEFEFGE